MPYIDAQAKEELVRNLRDPENVGELNYCITRLIRDYWEHNQRYQSINDVLGALEGAKLEFYRRVAEPYEDRKIQQNGDVYGDY